MAETLTLRDYAISGGLFETISRHGSAGAEFLKGLRGIDYETGQIFDRSLQQISNYKLNPDNIEKNLKQQAGFSAEVVSVSRKNAEAIIKGENNRFVRSEDLTQYGKNHNVVDIVELLDGQELSTSQMKFVSNPDELLKKIARGEGGGKNDLSRYMTVDKLEVPSEQVERMKQTCREQAKSLQEQADRVRQNGQYELAEKLEKQSQNYQQLEQKVTDSGMTTEQAIKYRLNPNSETVKDILGVSHEAGLEGAKFGAAIGGSISLITNLFALKSGEKEFGEAVVDTAKDTITSAGVGYGTAFTGTALKAYMEQSSNATFRALSKTGLPAAVVSVCLATTKSIYKYANNEIDEAELMQEMGLTVTGLLSSSMFTMIGQVAIPIPVLGGLIGGMVGYVLTNTFYQSFFDVLKNAKLAKERRIIIEMKCKTAQILAEQYSVVIQELIDKKITQLDTESKKLFDILNQSELSADDFCQGINQFAECLGKDLSIKNMQELDDIMLSDKPLII